MIRFKNLYSTISKYSKIQNNCGESKNLYSRISGLTFQNNLFNAALSESAQMISHLFCDILLCLIFLHTFVICIKFISSKTNKKLERQLDTVFSRIVSAESILFWIWPYVLWPLITVHKSADTIQGRKLFAEIRYMDFFYQ